MGPEAPGLASPCLLPLQGIQSVKTRVFEAATPFPRCRSRQSSLVLPNRAGPNAQAVIPSVICTQPRPGAAQPRPGRPRPPPVPYA